MSKLAEHLKLPLRVDEVSCGDCTIIDAKDYEICEMRYPNPAERAALIVRAVNCFDDLVEALKEVNQWISNWDQNFIYDDEWPATADKIRAILLKAEEAVAS